MKMDCNVSASAVEELHVYVMRKKRLTGHCCNVAKWKSMLMMKFVRSDAAAKYTAAAWADLNDDDTRMTAC